MRARISGLGQWLPPTVRENDAWPPEFAERSRASERRELVDVDPERFSRADIIAQRHFEAEAKDPFLGATRRRVAAPSVTAPFAEAEAARDALEDARISATELDVIISWAAVPERIVPPSAPDVAHRLGAERAYAIGMDAACATPIAQLELAAALVETGRARHVLLTQSHLVTRTFPLLHPASPNIGDAATAIVVSAAETAGIVATFARTHGEYYPAVTWRRGKDVDPPWWEAGPATYLGSNDREQAQFLVRASVRFGADTLRELLERAHSSLDDVTVLASVQPRRWIPGAIAQALDAPLHTPHTFDELAHLGGCGVVTNLLAARQAGLLREGDGALLYAQGAGFTRAACLVRWGEA
ncbi:MAG TPA: 3-oxoacyl-[acyl-carrier-protein] synthase III C-terminal domain-containing protein [Polyangiaceae bacterium]|nr:3-oxoacyl-[acyl-carrier-protein] synthase III C-terminal domain-containing protein [Polyangiaceae bacterium]